MPDEKITYLEPIEESDADTSRKFNPLETSGSKSGMEDGFSLEARGEKVETSTEKETLYQKILTAPSTKTHISDDQNIHTDAQRVSLQQDADSQVRQLVDLAMTKGVVHAVKVARRLGDFYVLDKMHDDLVSQFYEALVAKGLLTKE